MVKAGLVPMVVLSAWYIQEEGGHTGVYEPYKVAAGGSDTGQPDT